MIDSLIIVLSMIMKLEIATILFLSFAKQKCSSNKNIKLHSFSVITLIVDNLKQIGNNKPRIEKSKIVVTLNVSYYFNNSALMIKRFQR